MGEKEKALLKRVNILEKKHRQNLIRFLNYSLKNKGLVFWGNFAMIITAAC